MLVNRSIFKSIRSFNFIVVWSTVSIQSDPWSSFSWRMSGSPCSHFWQRRLHGQKGIRKRIVLRRREGLIRLLYFVSQPQISDVDNIVPLGQPCFAMGSPVFLAQILRAFFTVSHGSVDMTFFLARSAANEGNCNWELWDLVITFDWWVLLTQGQCVWIAFCKIFRDTPLDHILPRARGK